MVARQCSNHARMAGLSSCLLRANATALHYQFSLLSSHWIWKKTEHLCRINCIRCAATKQHTHKKDIMKCHCSLCHVCLQVLQAHVKHVRLLASQEKHLFFSLYIWFQKTNKHRTSLVPLIQCFYSDLFYQLLLLFVCAFCCCWECKFCCCCFE